MAMSWQAWLVCPLVPSANSPRAEIAVAPCSGERGLSISAHQAIASAVLVNAICPDTRGFHTSEDCRYPES